MPRRERPLGPGEDVVVRFAADLRRLRDDAGGPTYRDMSTRAGYSAAALSEAAGGRKLPGLALTTAYVATCGGDVGSWESRWRAVAAELAAAEGMKDAVEAEIPYLGLAAFQPGDAGRFFGREKLLAELTGKLARRRFVGVFGASGSGKSSLLRAGLAASEPGRAVVCTPGEHPLDQCADGLAASGRLVIVDQFEEVFTLCHDDAERAGFLEALLALAADEHGTRVVIGVRADFYGHCGRHAGLVDALRDAQVMVGPMTPDELRTVIVEPAVRLGCRVEAALVTTLVADAVGQPAVLPLVSHALLETWRRRQGITLTLAAYEAAGGIQNAIAHTAEAAYDELDPDRQARVRQIFLRLTALGEGTEDTKRRLHRRELDDDPATKDVLERLAEARLLALDRDGVDIAHEALIRSWPRLQDWLDEDREGHRLHRQLAEATDLWESLDRDAGSLYRGTRLGLAAEWATRSPGALTTREQAFLDAGLAAEAAEAAAVRRRTRRLRQLVALLGVLLLLAGVATVYAVRASQTATDQRNVALARKVVGDAADLRQTNPPLSAQLSLAAYRLAQVPEARDGLLGTLSTPFSSRIGFGSDGVSMVVAGPGGLMVTGDRAHTVQLWSVTDSRHPALLATLPADAQPRSPLAMTRDGRTLITAAGDNSLRLWDVRDPLAPVARGVLRGHTDMIYSADVSPDGHTLVTAGRDHTLRTWDIADPAAPRAQAKLGGTMTDQLDVGMLSSDGRTLVTTGGDKQMRLWDFADPARPGLLSTTAHPDLLTLGVFSPDRRTVATGGWDSVIRLWDVTDLHAPRLLASRTAGPGVVWSMAFSPDGRMLASTSDDKLVHLWDVTNPATARQLAQLSGSITPLSWVAFTPDGRTVLTAGDDRSVRLHDLAEFGPALRAQTVARTYTPDGRTLITSGSDVRLWAADGTQPVRELGVIDGFPGWITALALSPDGRSLVTASLSGGAGGQSLIQRWNITDPARPALIATVTTKPAYSFAFSPDGRRLAVGYDDGPTEIWDVSDPTRFAGPVTVPSDAGTIWTLAFTPDSRTLIVGRGGLQAYVRLWDVSGPPAVLSTLTAGTGGFFSLALAADGRTLAAGSGDWNTYLWDIGDLRHPVPLATLTGQTDKIASLSFTGRTLATASFGSVWLWDLTDAREPVVTARLTLPDSVNSVAFAPDGHTLATGSRTVQLWETDLERVARRICAVATPRITQAEWDTYLPGVPFTPPCP